MIKKCLNMFVLGLLAFSVLALPATVSASETSLSDITHGLKNFFAALPRLNSTDIDKMTQTVETIQNIPLNNTNVNQITEVVKAIEKNPPNNETLNNVTKLVQAVQKINTTTINQFAKAIQAVNNIQNNLSNRRN